MPISTKKLLNDLRRKINSFNTGSGQDYAVIDLVSALNEAYEIVVEKGIEGADKVPHLKNSLRELEVKNKKLNLEVNEDFVLAKYPKNLYKRLNQYCKVSCEDCENSKIIIPRVVSSDDLNEARKNPYRGVNFAWEQLVCDESKDGLYIYTEGKVNIDYVIIDYYRKINYLQAASLVECADYQYEDYDDKLITKDVDFELDSTYISRMLPDIAALLITSDSKNTEAFKLTLEQIMAVNKI
jgi:hypothetical protein